MLDLTGIPFVHAGVQLPDNPMLFELATLTRDEVFPGGEPGPSLQDALRAAAGGLDSAPAERSPAAPAFGASSAGGRGEVGPWRFEAAPEEILPVVLAADGSLVAGASRLGLASALEDWAEAMDLGLASGKAGAMRAAFDDVDGDGLEDKPIEVVGDKDSEIGKGDDGGGGDWGGWPGWGWGGDSGPGTGGPLEPVPAEPTPTEPNDTPCVNPDAEPEGVELRDVNRAALAAANAIEAKGGIGDQQPDSEEQIEWGSFIFVLNGVVGFTEPFTQNLPDRIHITAAALAAVPDGARIVGFVHNHTAIGVNATMDQRMPSPADWQIRDALVQHNVGRGVTVDPNMLLYIHAPDAAPLHDKNKTRVYDRTDRNDGIECSLQ